MSLCPWSYRPRSQVKRGDMQAQQTQSSLRDTWKGLLPEFASGIFLSSVMGNIHCVLSAELPAEPLTAPAGRTGTSAGEAWGEWDRVAKREKLDVPRHRCLSLGSQRRGGVQGHSQEGRAPRPPCLDTRHTSTSSAPQSEAYRLI